MDIQCVRTYTQSVFPYRTSHSILAHLTRSISRSKFPPRSFHNHVPKKKKKNHPNNQPTRKNEYPGPLILIHGSPHHVLSHGGIITAGLLLPSTRIVLEFVEERP